MVKTTTNRIMTHESTWAEEKGLVTGSGVGFILANTTAALGEVGVRSLLRICGLSQALIKSIVNNSINGIYFLRRITNNDIIVLARSTSSAVTGWEGQEL